MEDVQTTEIQRFKWNLNVFQTLRRTTQHAIDGEATLTFVKTKINTSCIIWNVFSCLGDLCVLIWKLPNFFKIIELGYLMKAVLMLYFTFVLLLFLFKILCKRTLREQLIPQTK